MFLAPMEARANLEFKIQDLNHGGFWVTSSSKQTTHFSTLKICALLLLAKVLFAMGAVETSKNKWVAIFTMCGLAFFSLAARSPL